MTLNDKDQGLLGSEQRANSSLILGANLGLEGSRT